MITDMKQTGVPNRTPFTVAQGGTGETGRPRVQMTKPVQTGNAGLTRPVMSNQDAAASRVGSVPQTPGTNPLIQSLPLSAAKPMPNGSQTQAQAFQLPMNPNAGSSQIPSGYGVLPQMGSGGQIPKVRDGFRASSAKGGPTPAHFIGSQAEAEGGWWDNWSADGYQSQQQAAQSDGFLGPWALSQPNAFDGTAPEQEQVYPGQPVSSSPSSPADIVRQGLSQLKNSEIVKILVDISNGRIRGLSDE